MMIKTIGGKSTFAGVNAQAVAAMSLFLQYMKYSQFSYIHHEAPGFQDFNLVFEDGKKIICESKDRKESFSYRHLKTILKNIVNQKSFGENDEVLIICRNASEDLVYEIEHVRFYDHLKSKFKEKKFTEGEIALLPRVKFWIVPATFNENVIYSLFADLINFWLPSHDIARIVDHILVQKMYRKAAKGDTYSKAEIAKEIADLATEAKNNSVYYNENLEKREEQFRELDKALSDPNHKTWNIPKELSAFSTDYERLKFAKDRLVGKQNQLALKNWDPIWQLNRVYFFNFGIFNIFENNLHTHENRMYVLDYLKSYAKAIRGFYQLDFFDVEVVKIISKIIDAANREAYLNDAFAIIKDVITYNTKNFFYLKDGSDDHEQWEKGEVCKVLHKLYSRAGGTLKQEVFKLLTSVFNLVEDDGEFGHHSPSEVFAILVDWLNEDFAGRFKSIVHLLADQYDRTYKKFGAKLAFKGWEHMGGGTSMTGNHYHVGDRHFVSGILAPAIRKYYLENPVAGWGFIERECLSKTEQVSKYRPDFLNRAVYGIVLERYASNDIPTSEEAFQILHEFVLSRKGIPHKSDLIYQEIVGSSLTDEKKWRLVELTTKKYGIPVNPFAEEIVANLVNRKYEPAREELERWFDNPQYYGRFMFDSNSVTTIRSLLETDFEFSVRLFRALLKSGYTKQEKRDHFASYEVAKLLHDIINKNYSVGLSILRSLEAESHLSTDQQIVYCYSWFNAQANENADDADLLVKIYRDVINPILEQNEDNVGKISARFSSDNCREAFMQFADRLASKKKIAEALRIVKIFIRDADPRLPNQDPNDPKNEYNEHKKIEEGHEPVVITSVRGWCGWVLMKCAVLEGRKWIPEIIDLTRILIKDENYYVVHMGCFALAQVLKNRLTVLPADRNILFFNDDERTALEMAKSVEALAFDLLDRLVSWPTSVQKAMTKSILTVFDPLRALNEVDALHLITQLVKLPDESIGESAPLFVFFAELRKNAYPQWKFSLPGLYDDLGSEKFDSRKFKKILVDTIKKFQKAGSSSCFRFAGSFEHLIREPNTDDEKTIRQYTDLAFEYLNLLTDVYAHDIFALVYRTVEARLQCDDANLDRWYQLLMKCFTAEKQFFETMLASGKIREVHWYPSLYHANILELLYQKMSIDHFVDAVELCFSFPKEVDFHEPDQLVDFIKEVAKANERARKILDVLVERNPSRYWNIKQS